MIILDFDGTVVDSMPALAQLAADVSIEFGLAAPGHTREDIITAYLGCSGRPFSQQLEIMFPGKPIAPAIDAFEARKVPITLRSHMTPGTASFLSRHWDQVLSIVSSTTRDVVGRYLYNHRLSTRVPYDGWSVGRSKLRQIRLLTQLVARPTFVGDSPFDEEIAEHLGIPFIHYSGADTWTKLTSRSSSSSVA